MPQLYLPLTEFVIVRNDNPLTTEIANRHYFQIWRGNIAHLHFVGTGERLILLEPLGRWLFCWRFVRYRLDGQTGVNCCLLFCNESDRLSSEIVLLAAREWDARHGATRKFTYVTPRMIRSTNPGYCFQRAGWVRQKQRSDRGLVLLSKEVS
jgi:hypothetical protein